MAWSVEFLSTAQKQLKELDRTQQSRILAYLRSRVLAAPDPRQYGKTLKGEKEGLWRYRVGDYRLICRLEDEKLIVLVLAIGHRREVYR